MMRIFLAAALLLGSAFAQTAAKPTPAEPKLPPVDRNALTFTHYNLRATVDPPANRLDVSGKLTVRNTSTAPQSHIALQVSSTLRWTYVRGGGTNLTITPNRFNSDVDHTGKLSEAIVALPQPLAPNATLEVEVSYSGTIAQDSARLTAMGTPHEIAATSDWDRISDKFSAVRGIGFVAWYPISLPELSISSGNDLFAGVGEWKARHSTTTFDLELCGPPALQKIVNANVKKAATSGAGCSQYSFGALGLRVPVFALGEFQSVPFNGGEVQYLSGSEEPAKLFATAAGDLAGFVTGWLGPSRRPVQIVQLPEADDSSWESGTVFFTPLIRTRDRAGVDLLLVHQLAHGSFRSPRPWMDEGLAHFMQAVLRERQGGRKAALEFLDRRRAALALASAAAEADPTSPAERSLINSTDEVMYRTKAMFVWWMLRDIAGDEALRRALAAYRADQDREGTYFQGLLEAEAMKDLTWFFSDWVYRDRGLPEFKIASAPVRESLSKSYLVTVSVENSGTAAAEVPVSIVMKEGQSIRRLLAPAGQTAVVRIEVPGVPLEVRVNDGSVPEIDPNNNTFQIPAVKTQ